MRETVHINDIIHFILMLAREAHCIRKNHVVKPRENVCEKCVKSSRAERPLQRQEMCLKWPLTCVLRGDCRSLKTLML